MKEVELPAYVLDSFAVLSHLGGEAGAGQVRVILCKAQAGRARIFLSIINYGEVLYITEREKGLEAAQQVVAAIDRLPVVVVDADRKLAFAAAHIKAQFAVSYADAFTVALSQLHGAAVVTGDPEFRRTESLAPVVWLAR